MKGTKFIGVIGLTGLLFVSGCFGPTVSEIEKLEKAGDAKQIVRIIEPEINKISNIKDKTARESAVKSTTLEAIKTANSALMHLASSDNNAYDYVMKHAGEDYFFCNPADEKLLCNFKLQTYYFTKNNKIAYSTQSHKGPRYRDPIIGVHELEKEIKKNNLYSDFFEHLRILDTYNQKLLALNTEWEQKTSDENKSFHGKSYENVDSLKAQVEEARRNLQSTLEDACNKIGANISAINLSPQHRMAFMQILAASDPLRYYAVCGAADHLQWLKSELERKERNLDSINRQIDTENAQARIRFEEEHASKKRMNETKSKKDFDDIDKNILYEIKRLENKIQALPTFLGTRSNNSNIVNDSNKPLTLMYSSKNLDSNNTVQDSKQLNATVTGDDVILRSTPSTSGSILRTLSKGERVSVKSTDNTGDSNSAVLLVDLNSKVNGQTVKLKKGYGMYIVDDLGDKYRCNYYLDNVKRSAIVKKEWVQVAGKNDWVSVETNDGKSGFVYYKYVRFD